MDYDIINQQCAKGIGLFQKANTLILNGKKDTPYDKLVRNLVELGKRYADQKLTVCIVGEVKAGKSSFINSLLGIDILAVAPEVCTNVPAKIMYGKEERILVHFMSDESGRVPAPKEITRQEITAYSTEKGNRENDENVDYIDIKIDSPLLAEGLVFIDTPGLGAIDPLHALATFRIAAHADIIFFLGACTKPLTQSEIESLKNILTVSKPKEVYHLLTCCDMKQSDEVLNANRERLEKDEDLKKHRIPIIEVSSKDYNDYVKEGLDYKLGDSGFQKVKAVIADLNSRLKDIIFSQLRTFVAYHCGVGNGLLKEAVDSVEKPDAVAAKQRELQEFFNRLNAIKENQTVWNLNLTKRQKTLNNEITQFVENKYYEIIEEVRSLLNKGDYFIKNTNELSQKITALLSKFHTELNEKVLRGFANVLEWLRKETGFIEINEAMVDTTLPEVEKNRLKKAQINIGQLVLDGWRVTITGLGMVGLGYAGGAALGAKIGGAIGWIGGPAGAGVGAGVGAAIGAVGAWFTNKFYKGKREEGQRKKILSEVTDNLQKTFKNIKANLRDMDIENSTAISTMFIEEIKEEQKRLKGRIDTLSTQSQRIHANLDAIKKLEGDCELICKMLNSDEK